MQEARIRTDRRPDGLRPGRRRGRAPALGLLLLLAGLGWNAAAGRAETPAAAGPQLPRNGRFEGRWTVTAELQLLPFAGGRHAFIARHRGELFLTRRDGLPRAWASDCLAYGERGARAEGRCTFSDDDGDVVYAEIASAGLATGRPISGRLVGGTGKYHGISGEFRSPGWRYAEPVAEEGVVQAFMDELRGSWSFP